jgi:hypothetical protein
MENRFLLAFIVSVVIWGCGSSDSGSKLNGNTPEEVTYELNESRLNLPIQIPLSELQQAINSKLPVKIISNKEIKGKYLLDATRTGTVHMVGAAKNLLWNVPIEITIKKERNEKVVSKFEILPTFKSEIGIENNYKLSSNSALIDLVFTDSASFKLFGIEIDITKLIESQIEKNSTSFTSKIDEEIGKLSVEKLLNKTWTKLRSPIRVNKKLLNVYLLGTPSQAIFHDYYFKDNNIYLDLTLFTLLETVFDSLSNVPTNFHYPPLTFAVRQQKGFELNIGFPLSYHLIDSLSNALLKHKTIEVEGEKLQIDSLHVSARDSFLVINAKLSGDWTAEMEVYGRPSYNQQTQTVFIDGFEFFIKQESSSIFQATDYLFHDEIKAEILDKLEFEVGPMVDSLPQMIYGAIEKGKSGDKINLETNIHSIEVDDFLIGAQQLVIILHGKGEANLEIEKIKKR